MHLWHTIGYILDMTIFGPFIGEIIIYTKRTADVILPDR